VPLKGTAKKVMRSMKDQYGEEEGERVFYATANKENRTPETWEKRSTAGIKAVVIKQVSEPREAHICPHCEQEIGEKESFWPEEHRDHPDLMIMEHGPCGGLYSQPKGKLDLPKLDLPGELTQLFGKCGADRPTPERQAWIDQHSGERARFVAHYLRKGLERGLGQEKTANIRDTLAGASDWLQANTPEALQTAATSAVDWAKRNPEAAAAVAGGTGGLLGGLFTLGDRHRPKETSKLRWALMNTLGGAAAGAGGSALNRWLAGHYDKDKLMSKTADFDLGNIGGQMLDGADQVVDWAEANPEAAYAIAGGLAGLGHGLITSGDRPDDTSRLRWLAMPILGGAAAGAGGSALNRWLAGHYDSALNRWLAGHYDKDKLMSKAADFDLGNIGGQMLDWAKANPELAAATLGGGVGSLAAATKGGNPLLGLLLGGTSGAGAVHLAKQLWPATPTAEMEPMPGHLAKDKLKLPSKRPDLYPKEPKMASIRDLGRALGKLARQESQVEQLEVYEPEDDSQPTDSKGKHLDTQVGDVVVDASSMASQKQDAAEGVEQSLGLKAHYQKNDGDLKAIGREIAKAMAY